MDPYYCVCGVVYTQSKFSGGKRTSSSLFVYRSRLLDVDRLLVKDGVKVQKRKIQRKKKKHLSPTGSHRCYCGLWCCVSVSERCMEGVCACVCACVHKRACVKTKVD